MQYLYETYSRLRFIITLQACAPFEPSSLHIPFIVPTYTLSLSLYLLPYKQKCASLFFFFTYTYLPLTVPRYPSLHLLVRSYSYPFSVNRSLHTINSDIALRAHGALGTHPFLLYEVLNVRRRFVINI